MRIKTQISLTLVLIIIAVAAVVGMTLYQQRELARLARGQQEIAALVRGAQEIGLMSSELLLYPSERVRAQWDARHQSFGALLASIVCCEEPRLETILSDVAREQQALLQVSTRLAAEEDNAERDSSNAAMLHRRLASALFLRSRTILSLLHELSDAKRMHRVAHIKKVALLAVLVDGFAFLVGGLLLWLLRRRLLDGMDGLSRGFQRVASGDLKHRVDAGWRNEFGDLARGFDRMTEQVARQTERLQRSEAALAASNRELEQKVASRTVELDNAVRQLYDAGEELAQSQRLATMGKLVASISHELNNPLMGALNYVQFVRPRLGDDALAAWLGKAESEITRATDVVQNLLAFGRKGAEKRQPVDLAPLVEDVLTLAAPALARAGAEAFNQVPTGLGQVSAQPKLLRQILLNLVLNAADAVAGLAQREIVIGAGTAGDSIRVFVEDTGPGVPESIRERIFEPFFTTKGKRGGNGLGLPLARRLAEGGGGTLAYVTRAQGDRFELLLPALNSIDDMLSTPPKLEATRAHSGTITAVCSEETGHNGQQTPT
jgi:C4-dicarboxylate-specific signal transduction histidine kinase